MESGAIPNSNITASSWWNNSNAKHPPYLARLNNEPKNGYNGSWAPASVPYGKFFRAVFV